MGEAQPSESRDRHPRNADGDFYVEYGCCTACDVPSLTAPELFAYDDDMHCYVCRQPSTSIEVLQMLRTLREQELGCIRYAGADQALTRRLAECGADDSCDATVPSDATFTPRDIVAFRVEGETGSVEALCADFIAWLRSEETEYRRLYLIDPRPEKPDAVIMSFAWVEGHDHKLRWSRLGPSSFAIEYVGGTKEYVPNVTNFLYDWISTRPFASEPRWHTREGWAQGAGGSELPW